MGARVPNVGDTVVWKHPITRVELSGKVLQVFPTQDKAHVQRYTTAPKRLVVVNISDITQVYPAGVRGGG